MHPNALNTSPDQSIYRKRATHLLGWLLYITWEQASVYYISRQPPGLSTLYFYGCNITLFYLHLSILRNSLESAAKPYLRCSILLIAELVAIQSFKLAGNYFYELHGLFQPQQAANLKRYLVMDLFRSVSFAGLATLYWFAGRVGDAERKAARARLKSLEASRDQANLEVQLKETENAYLQQQLNPHLLFNTLNFIYSRISPLSDQAAQCVLLLADLLRYGIDGADREDGRVSLAAEADMVRRLIELGTLRYERPLHLHLTAEGDLQAWRIMPLVLLTLSENIFKHGLVTDPERPATLRLTVSTKGEMVWECHNYKKPRSPFPRKPGIGLQALQKRLAYAYPGDRHQWLVRDCEEEYFIRLTVCL